VTLYTVGHACPLCDEALAHLRSLQPEGGFELRVVVIDSDPLLAVRHALRVPVIEVDGSEALHGKVTLAALRAALGVSKVARRP